MTYGVIVTVPAPIAVYDTLHRELLHRGAGKAEGLLLHVCRPIEDGFQVIEVWTSREEADRFNDEMVRPVSAEIFGTASPRSEPVVEEFSVRGLITSGKAVAR